MALKINRILGIAILMGLASIANSGCSGPGKPAWVSVNPNDWANRGETDEPVMLDVLGAVAVDVTSFNGSVTIEGNPKLTQAKVTVRREGVHGYGRTKEATASLEDIKYSAEVVPGDLGQVLRVQTTTTNAEPHFQRAQVFIELPDVENISVHTTNGNVTARNISGTVDVSTTHGEVRIMTNQAMTKPVTIINRDGDINYRIRAESTGQFDAQTVNGKVHQHVRYGAFAIKPGTQQDVLHGVLNDGTNPITLRTVNGDIRIAVVSDPESVGEFIMD